ncbi:hypothetical protein OG594_32565 [Streptomyces sp. NBC_01214]|uniref:hypothetical protein n=1 Tax=Streptomyces sp. NBC_01214 TaxID=2903777 RepID=UPI00225A1F43|nr:hypothetical protein [Streptomyces sp. NBC_01214]MCX4806299.1 hypothetical protein [Streptomyces sp. NBC_01214]
MNRRLTIDPVADIRVLVDKAEQIAQELSRAVAAVDEIVGTLKAFHEAVAPLVKRLRSTPADPEAEAQVPAATKE